MSRKVIQIALAYDHGQQWANRDPMWQPGMTLYGLCNDGTVWSFYPGTKWELLPPIPGSDADPDFREVSPE